MPYHIIPDHTIPYLIPNHNSISAQNTTKQIFLKVRMSRKISHFKDTLILRGFSKQSKKAFFFFCYLFLFQGYSSFPITQMQSLLRRKIYNISTNNEAMLLKFARVVAPYEIYHMVQILMLLWQHSRFQSSARGGGGGRVMFSSTNVNCQMFKCFSQICLYI